VAKTDLVPAYYDGADRSKSPIFLRSRDDIKAQRKAGLLEGSYQENGSVFILYRASRPVKLSEVEVWIPRQSGYAGPLVLQMVP
jgi:hypothetical protein